MIRSTRKGIGILLLTLAALLAGGSTGYAADVLEFIDIPVTDPRQGAVEPLLACRNGFTFGFHAVDKLAQHEDGPRPWDISFARDDGSLLIQEYPLWLAAADAPLVRNDNTFPYVGYYTLLWNELVPAGPLTTCYSGAGTGFCKTMLDIQDCTIDPYLVVDIAQIGPQATTRTVTDALVFEARAYDPLVGTANGDGISQVTLQIVDPASGAAVYSVDRMTPESAGTGVTYCALSADCTPWVFADHDFTWPNGEPVENGTYWLRATVATPDQTHKVVQTQIQIDAPPNLRTVHVPAGEFTMGTDADGDAEGPAHTLTLDDFWIMQSEVTNRQYAQCVQAGVCTEPQDSGRWRDPAYADHPVTGVDWEQATTFATWAGGRLPTEAEWEKACRGGDGQPYPWGDDLPTHDLANYDNSVGDTTPTGSYPDGASPYGALDMSGNVWEWTNSLFADYPYQADDGREDGRAAGRRVARGGSFYYTRYQLNCFVRLAVEPDVVNNQTGLRVVFDNPTHPEGVRFVSPQDGDIVPPVFDVEMAAEGIAIEPAGEIHANAGHFHILVDGDFVPPGELIPFDEQTLHFGQGQFTTTLELEPGVHVLRLQVANGAHIALAGDQYRAAITVTVEAEQ